MKKIALISLALVLVVCAVSCGGVTYKNDVKAADIATAVKNEITNGSVMVDAYELYLSSFNANYTSLISDWTIMYSSTGTLFDEFGIFKAENAADTDNIVTMINEFIQYRVDSDMGYVPDELPKIKNAETKVCGNYVMYAFLSEGDASVAFSAFEEALTK